MGIEDEGCLEEIQSSKLSSGQIVDQRSHSREGKIKKKKFID